MAFVWIRDDFVAHPKIVQLTDSQVRTWLKLLCWTARFRTRGFVPISIKKEVVGATTKTLAKYTQIGLLEERSDGWQIHDWDAYNGTGKEREQAKLRKQAQRDRERQERDIHRDNVTPPERDKVTNSLAPARTTRTRAETEKSSKASTAVARPAAPANESNRGLQPIGNSAASMGLALALIDTLRHKDDRTPDIILAFTPQLPPAAFATVREKITEANGSIRNDAGYAVAELQRLVDTKQYAA